MKEIVLLPLGDQSHIDKILDHLGDLVDSGREQDFALLLPTSQLLHAYRNRLVRTASRRLNLTTFDDMVAEAVLRANTQTIEMNAQTANALMAYILTEMSSELSSLSQYTDSRGVARELVRTVGQLRRANITTSNLAAAMESRGYDVILSDLLKVWERYITLMNTHGLADIETRYQLAADNLNSVQWLKAVREFHICWFFDFEPMQLNILARLADWGADLTIWLPFAHSAHEAYIQKTLDSLCALGYRTRQEPGTSRGYLCENLFRIPYVPAELPEVRGLAAPGVLKELDLVARKIKKLSAQGISAQEICLVVPDQQKYLPQIRRHFRECEISVSMPLVMKLAAVPWLREIMAIWRASAAGWAKENLLETAGCVYIRAHLPQGYDSDAVAWTIHSLGRQYKGEQWLTAVDQEIARLSSRAQSDCMSREGLEKLALYQLARSGLEAWICGIGGMLKNPLQPRDHCAIIERLLEDNADRIYPQGNCDEDVRDRAARPAVLAILKDFLACSELLGQKEEIGARGFLEVFQPWLTVDLALERHSPKSVNVISPAQIRGLSYRYVFVLGMNQGAFPRPVREHWLLTRISQLPGMEKALGSELAQERIFFHACAAASEEGLILSRQLPGPDQDAEASAFWREVDALSAGGIPEEKLSCGDLLPELTPAGIAGRPQLIRRLIYDIARGNKPSLPFAEWLGHQFDYQFMAETSRTEQRRESSEPPDNMDGILSASSFPVLEDRFGQAAYSISRLEQYARCPFSFFARYCLGLEAAPQDAGDYSPLDRGTLLHWLLEKYYTKSPAESETRVVLEALARDWIEEHGKDPEDILWSLRARDAVELILSLLEADRSWQKRANLRPVLHEASFGLPGSAVGTVRPGGGKVSFQGKIDRIDIREEGGETWAVVYDYKTSRGISQKDIMAGKSLQIPVYLAAAPLLLKDMGFTNIRVMGGGYYEIRAARLAGGIWNKAFTEAVGSKLGALEDHDFLELEHTLARVSQQLHEGIISGRYVPNPDSSACKWCEYSGCCRYDKNRFRLKNGREEDAAEF